MRKQTRVLAAAALFTLGASFSAFAAKKGDWILEDEGWMCLDKDGVAYTDEWCLSNGKEFYVDSDGYMVTSSWIDDGDDRYFVNSEGTKTINDWRFLAPYDDEDADYEWFYFGNKGKMVSNAKKVIGSKTYYFNTDGIMLTGWVDTTTNEESGATPDTSKIVYCDEDGARIMNNWIYVYRPGIDVEEDDLTSEDEHWYYLGSKGTPAVGMKSNIKNKTYLFNTKGEMLTGWVAYDVTGTSNEYYEIGVDGQGSNLSALLTAASTTGSGSTPDGAIYFCDEDNGYVKKDKWIKTWDVKHYYDKDDDDSMYWFYAQADGTIYIPDASTTGTVDETNSYDAAEYELISGKYNPTGDICVATHRTINKKIYAFNEDGEMLTGFYEAQGTHAGEIAASNTFATKSMFYYGESNDGVRKTGSVTAKDDCGDSYKFYFATKELTNSVSGTAGVICEKAAGITGAMNGKLYDQGLLQKADDYKYADVSVTVNNNSTGKTAKYVVNASGTIQTSYRKYEADVLGTTLDLQKTSPLTGDFTGSDTLGFNTGHEDAINGSDTNILMKGAYNVQ